MNRRTGAVLREEANGVRVGVQLAVTASGLLPDLVGNRVRTALFRLAGVRIGRGTVIGGRLAIAGAPGAHRRISIGERGWINADCYLDASNQILIGDDVALAQQVLILTQTHEIGHRTRRAAVLRTAPVVVGDGCWIGARATLLPGVTIGAGSIVAAGAVVNRDVAPDTLVAGVPARPVRGLP